MGVRQKVECRMKWRGVSAASPGDDDCHSATPPSTATMFGNAPGARIPHLLLRAVWTSRFGIASSKRCVASSVRRSVAVAVIGLHVVMLKRRAVTMLPAYAVIDADHASGSKCDQQRSSDKPRMRRAS